MTRHTPLSTGQKYGDIIKDGDLCPTTICILLDKGILTRVSTPPLSELSEMWEKRARKLNKAQVVTISDLIEANVPDVAKAIKMSSSTVRRWQIEAIEHLNPTKKKPRK
jgi:hypothetical protein